MRRNDTQNRQGDGGPGRSGDAIAGTTRGDSFMVTDKDHCCGALSALVWRRRSSSGIGNAGASSRNARWSGMLLEFGAVGDGCH